jgi:hypothetical protein
MLPPEAGTKGQENVMTYLVFCIFELKNASREDHMYAYADLSKLGMKKIVKSDDGRNVAIPATAVMGTFTGSSANDVRSMVINKVQEVFKAGDYRGEFFVVVSADWACGGGSN